VIPSFPFQKTRRRIKCPIPLSVSSLQNQNSPNVSSVPIQFIFVVTVNLAPSFTVSSNLSKPSANLSFAKSWYEILIFKVDKMGSISVPH